MRFADTGARPYLAVGVDGRNYWVKWPGNPHGNLSLAHEVVVAHIGELIGAPVRPTSLIYVDEALTRDQYVDGIALTPGTHVGSEVLMRAEELTLVDRVSKDGNARRFAAYLALWDLCLGTDLQLLYDRSADDTVWSIDHGLWFESLEGDWTETHLTGRITDSWSWPDGGRVRGLDAGALVGAADRLDRLSPESVADAVAGVPLEWAVSDEQLATLAVFVDSRRTGVAQRLRDLATEY